MKQPEFNQTEIIKTFNTVATGYDSPALRYFPFCADSIVDVVNLKPGQKVLDVATGTASVAIAAAQKVGSSGRVFGIDLAPGMLNKAFEKINHLKMNNIDLHEMDAQSLEFRNQYFDVILASFVIFLLDQPKVALKEWLRVLKPGGTILFTSFAENAFEPMMSMFKEDYVAVGGKLYIHGLHFDSPEFCCELLIAAGTINVKSIYHEIKYHLATPLEWWEILWNSGLRMLLDRLSSKQQNEFKLRHLENVKQFQSDEGIELSVNILINYGIKK